MAYASTEPTPVGIPASSPSLLPHFVAQETSSLLLQEEPPRAQKLGGWGGEDTGGESWGWGRCRQPRRKSAVPVMPGERVGNLGEEKARTLRTHPPQKPLEVL